jgi:hypothetical protein
MPASADYLDDASLFTLDFPFSCFLLYVCIVSSGLSFPALLSFARFQLFASVMRFLILVAGNSSMTSRSFIFYTWGRKRKRQHAVYAVSAHIYPAAGCFLLL